MIINFKTPLAASLLLLTACGPAEESPSVITEDGTDLPVRGITSEEREKFTAGDGAFDLTYREADGLGPLYIRASCASCHDKAGKGPGAVEKFAIVETDG